jgi:hypothetical protein
MLPSDEVLCSFYFIRKGHLEIRDLRRDLRPDEKIGIY